MFYRKMGEAGDYVLKLNQRHIHLINTTEPNYDCERDSTHVKPEYKN